MPRLPLNRFFSRYRRYALSTCDTSANSPLANLSPDWPQCSLVMNRISQFALWAGVALAGAFAVSTIALHRGEQINAMWLVVAAFCIFALGYRFYSKFVAAK